MHDEKEQKYKKVITELVDRLTFAECRLIDADKSLTLLHGFSDHDAMFEVLAHVNKAHCNTFRGCPAVNVDLLLNGLEKGDEVYPKMRQILAHWAGDQMNA